MHVLECFWSVFVPQLEVHLLQSLVCLSFPVPADFIVCCTFLSRCTTVHSLPLLCSVTWLQFLFVHSSRVSHYFPGITTVFCFQDSLFFHSFYIQYVPPAALHLRPFVRADVYGEHVFVLGVLPDLLSP